jgi:hypothetical protein
MHTTRETLSLEGAWRLAVDPQDAGVAEGWADGPEPSGAIDVQVPSVWDRWIPDYDGVGWYFKEFDAPPHFLDRPCRLHFDAADYHATVYLNGTRLGEHEGGYTPFYFAVEAHLRAGANRLAVRIVDPHGPEGFGDFGLREIPSAKEVGYYGFAGLWGGVRLESLPGAHVTDVFVQPDVRRRRIAVAVECAGGTAVRIQVAGTPHAAEGAPGTLHLEFPDFEPWCPEQPVLYTLITEVIDGGTVSDRMETRFGMREFTIKDNRFHLNNRPIFLKGVLLQPDYPRTLACPESRDVARRELELVKAAGFNLVRTHIKTPCPVTLELADELGLLIYEEPPIGWIKASPRMRERCEREVREMILRDRNHPSVVIWGMLNETGNAKYVTGGGAQSIKEELCRIARALDPTRIVIDDSGGTNATREPARFMRPFRDELEPYDDLHIYQRAPVDQDIERYFRHNGQPGQLCFLSEFGFGGPEDLADVLAQYGDERETLKDARCVAKMLEASERGFAERGLDRIFADFSGFLKAARELQADAARHQVDAIRANAKWAGYCYTQLADAGHEFCAGLLDRWRRPKPVLETFKKLHQPLRPLIQMPRTNLTPREQVPVTVLLLNEARLEGMADLSLQVVGPTNQVLWKKRRAVKLPKSGKELWTGSIGASGSTGTHKFVVRILLQNRIVAENSVEFFVYKPVEATDIKVHVLDGDPAATRKIAAWCKLEHVRAPIHIVPPLANTIRGYPDNELLQILAQVEEGAIAVFLSPPDDWNDLADRIDPGIRATPKDAVGGFLPVAHYVKLHPIFEGLPSRGLMRQPYRNVVPEKTFLESGDEDICGAYDTTPIAAGEYMMDQTTWWGNDLLIRRLGSGRVVFTHLRLLEWLNEDPLAQRLFVNLLQHLSRRSVPPETILPPRKEPVEWLRRELVERTRKWMVIGEFPNWDSAGHHTAYPPEQAVELGGTYPGWYRAVSWRPWYARWNEEPELKWRLDLQQACAPVYQYYPRFDHGTGYAYAEFVSDKRQEVRFDLGVQNAMKVWLNGTLVHESDYQVPHDQVRWERATGWIKQGRNTLLVKCSKNPGPFRFSLDLDPVGKETLALKWWR